MIQCQNHLIFRLKIDDKIIKEIKDINLNDYFVSQSFVYILKYLFAAYLFNTLNETMTKNNL